MKYKIKTTKRFEKDLKIMVKRGYKIELLKEVIDKLANGIELEAKYKNHNLVGNWNGYKECHITPDWLLIYLIEDDVLVLTLTRTGSHSDLF